MHIVPENAQDIGKRNQQQDAFGFSNLEDIKAVELHGALAVVADGMGGMEMGQESSNLAKQIMLEAYQRKSTQETPHVALLRGATEANQAVFEMADKAGVAQRAGTTMVATVIHQNSLSWISVGDSRIYLFRNNELIQLNKEHTYEQQLNREVIEGKISRVYAEAHPEKHALTSFIGVATLSEIDYNEQPLPLEPNDRILLCSDGLHGTLSDEEISAILEQNSQGTADELVQTVLDKQLPHQDNVTVALLNFEPQKKSTFDFLQTRKTQSFQEEKPSLFRKILPIGILLLLALGAYYLWQNWSSPSVPTNLAYVAPQQRFDESAGEWIQDIRGFFTQSNQLEEGKIVWLKEGRSKNTDGITIDVGEINSTFLVPNLDLQGIVRSEETQHDLLLFTEHTDSTRYQHFIGFDVASKKFVAKKIGGNLADLEDDEYGYIFPQKIAHELIEQMPNKGTFKKEEAFLPKLTKLDTWLAHTDKGLVWFDSLKTPKEGLAPLIPTLSTKATSSEVFSTFEKEIQSMSVDDPRFKIFEIATNDKWVVTGYHFEDLQQAWVLVFAENKTMKTIESIFSLKNKKSEVCLPEDTSFTIPPAGDSKESDIIQTTFNCPSVATYQIDLASKKWKKAE